MANYKDVILADGPVGYWRLGEPSGATATDSSGNANHGTYVSVGLGSGSALGGDPDTSGNFGGVGQVNIPTSATLQCLSAWTIECWGYVTAYPTAAQSPCFFSQQYPGTNNAIQTVLGFDYNAGNTGKMMAGVYTGSAWFMATASQQFPLNQWVYVAGTYTGTSLNLYINGMSAGSVAGPTAPLTANTSQFQIGRRWDGAEFISGYIDDVALYNKALNAGQLAAHHAAGAPRNRAVSVHFPYGFWPLGESAGTVAYDLGLNGKNGTYTGGVTKALGSITARDMVNSCLFDGTSGYVLNTDPALAMGNSGTMEVWVRLDAGFTGNPRIMAFGANQAWEMYVDGGRQVRLFMFNGVEILTGFTLTLGQTYHLCATISTTAGIILYVDGVQVYSTPWTSSASSSGMKFSIGQSGNNADYWKGIIAGVALYTSALPAATVAAHYRAGRDFRRWDGSAWVSLVTKRWDGTQWVLHTPKRWDGSAWV